MESSDLKDAIGSEIVLTENAEQQQEARQKAEQFNASVSQSYFTKLSDTGRLTVENEDDVLVKLKKDVAR